MKIEDGIPIPPRVNSSGRIAKYPWDEMKRGSSFFLPTPEGVPQKTHAQRIRNAATARQRKGNKEKYVVRVVKGGARCWRTK